MRGNAFNGSHRRTIRKELTKINLFYGF